MSDLASIRKALATALQSIDNVQVNAYALSQPTPPGLQVIPPGIAYDKAMHRGLDLWTFIVQGFVSFTNDIGSQQLLDQLCATSGANSVKRAIESDRSLGGVVQQATVIEQTPGRMVEQANGNPLLLVEWRVEIYATG